MPSLPLCFFWDWFHGAIYGFVFLMAFLFAEHANHFLAKRARIGIQFVCMPKEDLRSLTKWAAITFVVMLLNPYGPLSYDVFVEMVSGNKMVVTTIEFLPASWEEHKPFWVLSCLVGVSILARGRRVDIAQLIVLAPFFFLSVRYSRVIGVFSLLAVPILAANISTLSDRFSDYKIIANKKGLVIALASLVSILYVGHYKFFAPETPQSFGVHMSNQFLPVGSVQLVKDVGLTGNLYNSGKFGGYLSFLFGARAENYLFITTMPYFLRYRRLPSVLV